jgi:hypothetical protein
VRFAAECVWIIFFGFAYSMPFSIETFSGTINSAATRPRRIAQSERNKYHEIRERGMALIVKTTLRNPDQYKSGSKPRAPQRKLNEPLVYEFYGLSVDEIRIVEQATA